MNTNRAKLLSILETIAPALSENDQIPAMQHMFFNGKRVVAFNGKIGISAPMPVEFTGGMPGKLLMSILASSDSETVSFEQSARSPSIKLKAGNTKAEFAVLPYDRLGFGMPPPPKPSEYLITDRELFCEVIDNCLQTLPSKPTKTDHLGVTAIPDDNNIDLYSTDQTTLTHGTTIAQTPLPKRIIISTDFCQQLLRFKDTENLQMALRDKHIIAIAGAVAIFGSLIPNDSPLDMKTVFERFMTDQPLIPIPPEIKGAMDRAVLIADAGVTTSVRLSNNEMDLTSESSRGKVTDKIKIVHGDIEIMINAKRVREGCDRYDHFVLTNKCVVMGKNGCAYLVANKQ